MNLWQLFFSFQAIYESLQSGMTSIGYVTPYRAQAKMMSLLVEDLLQDELTGQIFFQQQSIGFKEANET